MSCCCWCSSCCLEFHRRGAPAHPPATGQQSGPERAAADALVVSVSATVPTSSMAASSSIPVPTRCAPHPQEQRGCGAHRAGHDPCRWTREHQSVVTAMDVLGHLGFTQITLPLSPETQAVRLEFDPRRAVLPAPPISSRRAAYTPAAALCASLCGHYLLGVLGMLLYCGTDLLTIIFTKSYLTSALALEQAPPGLVVPSCSPTFGCSPAAA